MNLPARSLLVCLIALNLVAWAQADPHPYLIQTIAGNGEPGAFPTAGGRALDVPVDQPFGLDVGPDNALYITSVGQHCLLRLDLKTGRIISVAGNGSKGYSGDGGPASNAQLNEPYEVRFDPAGNMYFVEMQNHVVRRVDARSGNISTVAGTGTAGYGGDDGPATKAQLRQPHSIALDDRGQLYIADIGNHRIRRVDLADGTITSIAGNGEKLPARWRNGTQPADGRAPALAITGRTLWIALREGHSVWQMDLDSLVARHVAGTGKKGYSGNGPAATATFNGPKGIAATSDGMLYVMDTENQVVRQIDTRAGRVTTIAGQGPSGLGYEADKAPALSAKMDRPHGICLGIDGSLYIGDTNNHRVRWLHR